MKYYALLILITMASLGGATDFRTKYNQLQQNPGYEGMSKLEIAISIGDFPAIRHFSYKASLESLKKSRELLKNKLDIRRININSLQEKLKTAVSKGLVQRQISKEENMQRMLKNELNDIKRRIRLKSK